MGSVLPGEGISLLAMLIDGRHPFRVQQINSHCHLSRACFLWQMHTVS